MSKKRSKLNPTLNSSGRVKSNQRLSLSNRDQNLLQNLRQIYRQPLNSARSSISNFYTPSSMLRSSSPPASVSPRVTDWFKRLYSALPRRSTTNWEKYEQELYTPAVESVRKELKKALPELENRDIYSGIDGESSWSQQAKTRAFSDSARIIGDLRSQAGVQRKEAEMSQASRDREEALKLLQMASDAADKEADTRNTARMEAWKTGEQARLRDLLQKGSIGGDILRTLLSAIYKRGDAKTVSSLAHMSRRMLR